MAASEKAPEVLATSEMAVPRAAAGAGRSLGLPFAAAVVLHAIFAAVFFVDDLRGLVRSSASAEISVDLVDEADVPGVKTSGSASSAGKKGGAGGDRQSAEGTEGDRQAASQSVAADTRQSDASHAPASSEEAAGNPGEAPAASAPPPASPAAPPREAHAGPVGPVEPPPAPAQGGAPPQRTPAEQPAAPVGEGQSAPRLPSFLMPDLFGTTAAPTGGSALNEDYKGTIYAMLERAKRYPETARARQATGMAVVTFEIDEAGAPKNILLARTSGQGDLDREAVALVARAAPFPPPPAGVQRSFAPAITFGLN